MRMAKAYSARSRGVGSCVVFIAWLGLSGATIAAPITTDTALPIAADEYLFRSQAIYARASSAGTPARTLIWENVFGYGFGANWAGFVVVPTIFQRLETAPDLVTRNVVTRNVGIGDVRAFLRYTAFKYNGKGYTYRLTPFAGVELPTGNAPIGSRSTDPFAGIVSTYLNQQFEVDLSARYQWNLPSTAGRRDVGAGLRQDPGDDLALDGSFQYRIWPRKLKAGKPDFIYLVGETNFVHISRREIENVAIAATKRNALFLSPGLQRVTGRGIWEASVQIPVFDRAAPGLPRADVTLRAGFRLQF